MDIVYQLVTELNLKPEQISNTLELLHEGATVPFIARYRKERTGDLDETQIRNIGQKHQYYQELDERRDAIIQSISSQGKLTPELEKKIKHTLNKTELEDLYLPHRPKKSTRASKARDAGLEPLAVWLRALEESEEDLLAKAKDFIHREKGFETAEKALQGACDILAEELSDDADNRKQLRDLARREGFLVSSVKKKYADQKTKYQMYHDFREKVDRTVSHRMLAMMR